MVKNVIASYEALINLFERTQHFLQRLNHYTATSLTPEMMELLAKILAQVLSVLALSTKEMKERKISALISRYFFLADYGAEKFMKRLVGKTEVEDGLQRLDMLTKEENLMMAACTLEVAGDIRQNVNDIRDDTCDIKDDTHDIKEDTRNLKDDACDIKDDTRNIRDDTCDIKDNTRDIKDDTHAIKGDTRDIKEDTRDIKEDTHDIKDDTSNIKEDTRNIREDTRNIQDIKEDTRNINDNLEINKRGALNIFNVFIRIDLSLPCTNIAIDKLQCLLLSAHHH